MKLFMKPIAFATIGAFSTFMALGTLAPASAGSMLEAISAKGAISVGTEAHYPPMEFLEDGKIVGYGKDILDLVIADMGVKLDQLELPWQGILPGILAKKFDIVATSVSITPERVAKYAFTRPIATFQTMIIKKDGDDSVAGLGDLNGKVIGVELGSIQVQQLEALDGEMKNSGGSGFSEIRAFTSTDDMRLSLASGQVDLATIPSIALGMMQKQRPGLYAQVGTIGEVKLFAWLTHPDSSDLRDRVSEVILRLQQDGTLTKLQMKWFGFEMDLPTEGYLPEGAL
ncbi:MAG: transporter substrate-binding domain-containing protein [Proteobacteria bacterium]|nr:transporter substrate-binding domain-containing protein [Pseudomonadota bacterium]